MIRPTFTEYDALDRFVKVTFPDESESQTDYRIENEKQITEATDPLGNKTVTEKDARGNITSVVKKDSANKELTRTDYEYNELGEMLCVTDAKGFTVTAGYDILGRRTFLESADSGRKEYFYD